jgi:N-acetyl-gamma-glutamyl-phosphate reductase
MTRGMLASVYAVPSKTLSAKELTSLYRAFYKGEPFIRILDEGELPSTKHVWGTNCCAISARIDARSGKVLIIGVIDNLLKGASGQAIQNMNVVFGLPETAGLRGIGIYP